MKALPKKNIFSEFFPVPEYLRLANAGLAITDSSVKFADLRHKKFEQIPLPEGVVQSGFINEPEKLTEVLKDTAARHKLSYVYATLPEERAYLFTAVIDKVPEEGLRDAVAFIIEENAPVTLANSVFDFDVVGEIGDSRLLVTVSVISKKFVDFYVQVFEAAGLTPVAFEIESQATARAIISQGDNSTQSIVNLGQKKTAFYIVEDGVVQFTTTLPYGVGTRESSHSRLGDIKTELGKVFTFWNARVEKSGMSEKAIENMLLCGPGSFDENVVNEFKKDSEVPCEVASVPAEFPDEALNHLPLVGLMMTREDMMYKLLPEAAKEIVGREYSGRRAALSLLVLIVVLIIGVVGLFPAYIGAKAKRIEIEERVKVSGNSAISTENENFKSWLKNINMKLELLSPSLTQDASEAVALAIGAKPSGVRIATLNWRVEEGSAVLLVSGVSDNRQALLDFENNLNDSGYFAQVSLPLSSLAKGSDIPFQVNLRIDKQR